MGFFKVVETSGKRGNVIVSPGFLVQKSDDLMIRGGDFYAVWDPERKLWSTDQYIVQRIVDDALYAHAENLKSRTDDHITVQAMLNYDSGSWKRFQSFAATLPDSYHQLDERLVFGDEEITKEKYASRKLPYSLEPEGDFSAWDELVGTLYDPEERLKIEWSIGSIIAGESRSLEKFVVFYGESGLGKSTIIRIIQKLFTGYYVTFEAKTLGMQNSTFALSSFASNPIVAIQHDGDLSKIEDNTRLNSLTSHELMTINEKYKSPFDMVINTFLFMGTNKPVRITDSKSGLVRRLIDVMPSGRRIPTKHYNALISQIDFELGAIAAHCERIFRKYGKNYYADYKPLRMMAQTDHVFNFVDENYLIFKQDDGVTLNRAWLMYKEYIETSGFKFALNRVDFREELKSYFRDYTERARIGEERVRNYYSGFITERFESKTTKKETPLALVLGDSYSNLDSILKDCPAQYANENDTPKFKWDDVDTTLKDIDTSQVHYVLVPENHIVIDFDLKDAEGNKSMELNLEAADKFPPTYAELSKGGGGVHLHYIYEGDVSQLAREYAPGIEIKVFSGKSSLRRRVSKTNNFPIATINSGLPLKEEPVINFKSVANEKAIRTLITKNLNKEIHPATKPSVDFIAKILNDAYEQGVTYDVTDLRPSILYFASQSTNHSLECIKIVKRMPFKSEDAYDNEIGESDKPIVFFDVEVFPNLFIVCWKPRGADRKVVRMINPSPQEMEELVQSRLVGFNNRRYDNHVLYARMLGLDNDALYQTSKGIIEGSPNAKFAQAYGLSYTDIYDFSSKKQSLKKFEIDLGILHKELGLDWDKPVPEHLWEKVADYCENDVLATEAVFEARSADFTARQILADLSGLTVNDTTQNHAARILFGTDKNASDKFEYTDLSEMFPGYEFDNGTSTYRGEVVGEGGYVYAEPGMYGKTIVLDIASQHPTSAIQMNVFGPYTKRLEDLLNARLAIKHREFDKAREMLDGILKPYLTDESQADPLSYALKIVINIIYGLTSAKYDNPFRDIRNKDNIVAKRGALFMIDLKHEVQSRGFTVAHIKTDSIKIPDATPEIIEFVTEFGKKYGYTFEVEDEFEKMCLVNDAVYIGKTSDGEWHPTGAQFRQPYVFKKLFSKEEITYNDHVIPFSVTSALYLDLNEDLPEEEHNYKFVGKTGAFVPVKEGQHGGALLRGQNGKYYSATGAKGYKWLESEVAQSKEDLEIDRSYFERLVDNAFQAIQNFGDATVFCEL